MSTLTINTGGKIMPAWKTATKDEKLSIYVDVHWTFDNTMFRK